MIKYINQINIENKRVLIRADFNVPILNNAIDSDFRIISMKSTIDYCIKNNAKIILMSHLGRPKALDIKLSLLPIYIYLKNIYSNVYFSDNCISEDSINLSKELKSGDIHLLENLRFYSQELDNCSVFAKSLSEHGEIYINDAFGTSHRKHASNSAILNYFKEKAFGFLMEKEFEYLSNINFVKNKPISLILGGSKISSKLNMIKYFLGKADYILIGGGMAFTFLKVLGYNIGKSLFEEDMIHQAKEIISNSKINNTKILLPIDIVCSKKIDNNSSYYCTSSDSILDQDIGLDIGANTIKLFKNTISKSKLVLWNGPLGAFELSNFEKGSRIIAEHISSFSQKNDFVSIVGGGDTASCVLKLGLENNFSHVSTGGGASLQLLSGKNLQIIESWSKYGE